jgi:hypothetical protein
MTDNSAYDQWVDEAGQGKKRGWPILTTIIGAIVLLLISGNGSGEVGGGSTAYMMGRLIGGPLVLTVIVWGICYAVTYRHRGAGWQLGSFILFLMVSAVAVLFSIGSRGMALQEEADAVALTNERIRRRPMAAFPPTSPRTAAARFSGCRPLLPMIISLKCAASMPKCAKAVHSRC